MREIKFRTYDGKNIRFDMGVGELLNEGLAKWVNLPIMQFTGLQDKNDVDIYEGDILHQSDPVMWNPLAVEYSDVAARFIAGGSLSQSEIISSELVVIGNIHENPELLNEVKAP